MSSIIGFGGDSLNYNLYKWPTWALALNHVCFYGKKVGQKNLSTCGKCQVHFNTHNFHFPTYTIEIWVENYILLNKITIWTQWCNSYTFLKQTMFVHEQYKTLLEYNIRSIRVINCLKDGRLWSTFQPKKKWDFD